VGSYFIALVKVIAGQEEVTAPSCLPYPEEARTLEAEIRLTLPGWQIYPPDMHLGNLVERASLQCWTLKPAWARDAERHALSQNDTVVL